MRLIDADIVKDALGKYFAHVMWLEKTHKPRKASIGAISMDVLNTIDEVPTVDAVPVVRGRWQVDEDGNVKCSVCGNGSSCDNFCEHCGANMMEGEENG